MRRSFVSATALLGILLLVGVPASRAAGPSSGPHAWKDLPEAIEWEGDSYRLYPETSTTDPGLPSPCLTPNGIVTVTAELSDGTFALVVVTLTEGQRFVNGEEFPDLARTGLHAEPALLGMQTITGRSLAEITELGRPGGLSTSGFLAADEDVISVLVGDNRLVSALGLTHPELAQPLLHVLNLLETDIGFVYPNHSWDGLRGFSYRGREIRITGKGTKGGQESIFDDGIEGAWDLNIWRQPDEKELAFLETKYGHLGKQPFSDLIEKLSRIHTGEMEPQYIMRYGFYEGHTDYRTDPLAVAFVFGLRTVQEIEAAFPGKLPDILTNHFTNEAGSEK